jgi:outer membrane protein assembly factor BamE
MKIFPHHSRSVRGLAGFLLSSFVLAGCAEFNVPGVYRIDVQQGNVITQAQLAALESGMEKRKVRFILGTPLVTDSFNQQRWDYYYSLEKAGEERVQRIISVFFDGDLLTRIGGDVLAATGPIKLPERIDKVVTIPDGYRDEGLFASITPGFLSDKPKRRLDEEAASKEQGFLASLVPSFLSTEQNADVQTQDTAASQVQDKAAALPGVSPTQQAESAPPATPTVVTPRVEVDAEDERYLRDLLGGLGRDTQSQSASPSGDRSRSTTVEQDFQEGWLSRWATLLGLDKDGAPVTDENTDGVESAQ